MLQMDYDEDAAVCGGKRPLVDVAVEEEEGGGKRRVVVVEEGRCQSVRYISNCVIPAHS